MCFDLVDKKCRTPTSIFLAYRPPSTNDLAVSYLYQLIECLNTYQIKSFINIITGDLNLPKIDWYQLFSPSDSINPFLSLQRTMVLYRLLTSLLKGIISLILCLLTMFSEFYKFHTTLCLSPVIMTPFDSLYSSSVPR